MQEETVYYSSNQIHELSKECLHDFEPSHVNYGSIKAIKFGSLLFIIGFILSLYGIGITMFNKPVPVKQFNITGDFLLSMYKFSGNTKPTLQLINEAYSEDHPLHSFLYSETLNYTYGTHRLNLTCQQTALPTYTSLPSILRLLSFYQEAQVLMRTALLLSFHMRIHLCWAVTAFVAIKKKSFFTQFFSIALPILEIPWMIFALFILMFQHSIDYEWSSLFDKYISIFGMCFGIYASLYTIFTMSKDEYKNIELLIIRVACLMIFLSTVFNVEQSYISFINEKPCHYFVPYKDALLEYAALASIFIFMLTQLIDLQNFDIVLASSQNENISISEFYNFVGCFWQSNYYPAYLFQSS